MGRTVIFYPMLYATVVRKRPDEVQLSQIISSMEDDLREGFKKEEEKIDGGGSRPKFHLF